MDRERSGWAPRGFVVLVVGVVIALGLAAGLAWSPSRPGGPASDSSVEAEGTGGLDSWHTMVACPADLVTPEDILGPAYPAQTVNGSRYQTSATDGGIPVERDLTPPCTITNVSGQVVSSFVEIHGVYLSEFFYQSYDCANRYANVNGGRPFPNNQSVCEWQGKLFKMGTTQGSLQIEFVKDWFAKGYCGPGVTPCDNATLLQHVSNGTHSLDVQGFVYWDGENWDLGPFTGWRLTPPAGFNPPRGLHLSYLDDPTTAVLTWATRSPETSRVDWGPSAGGPYPSSAHGTDYQSPGGSYLHTVTLTGLTPGQRYYYRAGNGTMASASDDASFRAAPARGSTDPFSFAAAGDWGNNLRTAEASLGILHLNPDLVLPAGDLYYSGNETDVSQVFEKWMFGKGSFVQTAIGNHEYLLNGTTYTPTDVHCAFVNLPGNERTYAFTFGNTFFLTVDWGSSARSKSDGVDGSGQACQGAAGTDAVRSWVDARLAAANADANITWKVVFQHFQCYDVTTEAFVLTCPDGNQTIDQIEDILTNRGVDLVVTAHNHGYGRTHPVTFHSLVMNGSQYETPGAPIYLVLGAGGASQENHTCRTEAWVAACRSIKTYGFGHFLVSPSKITYEFVENDDGVVDSFELSKASRIGFSVSVEPTSLQTLRSRVANATVNVVGSSADPVSLNVSGCPASTTCTLAPTTGSPGFSSTLRIQTSASSPLGSFDLVIVARNATISRTATVRLVISDLITRTFQKGDGGAFSETDDTYLYDGLPDNNYGTDTKLFVDGADCIAAATVCKTLIKFPSIIGANPGQVTPGSTILNASLELTITNSGLTEDAYQVTQSWGEATATWNGFSPPGIPATKPREFTFAPSPVGRISLNLTSIVQRWANGEMNEGILLASTHWNGVDYGSSESTTPPRLTVQFAPPPPTTNVPTALAIEPAAPEPSCTMEPVVVGAVLTRSDDGTPVANKTVSFEGSDDNGTTWRTLGSGTTDASGRATGSIAFPTAGAKLVRAAFAGDAENQASTSPSETHRVVACTTVTFRKGDGGAYSETDDAFITSSKPTTNFGKDSHLRMDAKDCTAGGGMCRSLFMFPNMLGPNKGQVPLGSRIVSAKLQFTVSDPGGTQSLYQVTETWTELGVKWNSFAVPGSPGTKGIPISFAAPKGLITVDITTIVQAWANGDANLGVFIRTDSPDLAVFGSSEAGGTTRPKLTVTFAPGSPPPMNDSAASTSAPLAIDVALLAPLALVTRVRDGTVPRDDGRGRDPRALIGSSGVRPLRQSRRGDPPPQDDASSRD